MENIELKEFVQKVLADVEGGVEVGKRERGFDSPIKFEISVTKTEKVGGGLKIYVASGEGGIEKESVAKISFEVWTHESNERRSPKSIEPWDLEEVV